MTRFAPCLAFTLKEEGGFVDDPRDPGGATNMGITLATLRLWRDDAGLGAEALRALTHEAAAGIYGAHYWNRMRCDGLPAGVDLMVFDFGVNAGAGRAALLLQDIVGAAADGFIGAGTLRLVARNEPAALTERLAARQEAHYRALPGFATFGRGWLARTARRQATALGMARGA
jgi:lysozyme family protein